MKTVKLIALFFVFSLFLVSCKSSEGCGCLHSSNNIQTEQNDSLKA